MRGSCLGPGVDMAPRPDLRSGYGVVVLSVNVSVLLYVPVRSASVLLTVWLSVIVTGSLLIGAFQVSSGVGADEPPTADIAAAVALPGLLALTCSFCGRANAPLTSWPVFVALGSATDSAASPAVEIT